MTSRAGHRPRVALIGVSGYARVHLQQLREFHDRGELQLVAAVIINADQEAEAIAELRERGATIYASYEQLMQRAAGAIELCVIPTGIQWHARMTIAALQAGMNVLVEKPLAGSVEDVRAIRDAERASRCFVAVGFQDIYAPENVEVKSRLCAGAIGRLRSVRLIGLWPRTTAYYVRNQWAGRLTAEGASVRDSPLNNALGHFVHLALFFASPALRQSARVQVSDAELLRAHQIESFDTAIVRGVSADGVQFWIGVSHACREQRDPEIHIEGAAGTMEWRHQQYCTVTSEDGQSQVYPLGDNMAVRRTMLSTVLRRLDDPTVPVADVAMAESHSAFIETLHRDFPVRTLPAALLDDHVPAGEAAHIPAIRGIERAMETALASRSLLREIGFFRNHPLPVPPP